jgi:cell division protein FtsA
MLPAGIVLTGGTSSLMGIKEVAYQIFKMPIRLAKPTRLEGLSEGLDRPEFSTATGLIRWNANKYKKAMYREVEHSPKSEGEEKSFMDRLMIFLKRLLPIENEEQ